MTDQEVLATKNDLEMMRRPHLWPHGNLLPLKHRTGRGLDRPVAVLFHYEGEYGMLEGYTMFELEEGTLDQINWADANILPEINQNWMVD